MSIERIIADNCLSGLYFLSGDRIIYLPQNWASEFVDSDPETNERETLCWYGNEHTLAFQNRTLTHEWLSTDSQAWFSLSYLDSLITTSETIARTFDPDLFTLLDAVDSGLAT